MTHKDRLEYLRQELRAERISFGELHELQGLANHIEPGDVELLEAAGVPEFDQEGEGNDMTYFAMIVVVEGDSADQAYDNLTRGTQLPDEVQMVGNPWKVQPITRPDDTDDPQFDTGACIGERA